MNIAAAAGGHVILYACDGGGDDGGALMRMIAMCWGFQPCSAVLACLDFTVDNYRMPAITIMDLSILKEDTTITIVADIIIVTNTVAVNVDYL